jgi:hypothetical protein
MTQLLATDEQHPADIDFLPDVEGVDGGYLFVIEEVTEKRVAVYRWSPSEGIVLQDHVFQGFPGVIPDQPLVRADSELYDTRFGPDFVFVDRVGSRYYLPGPRPPGLGHCTARGCRRPVPILQAWPDGRVRLRARLRCSRGPCARALAPVRSSSALTRGTSGSHGLPQRLRPIIRMARIMLDLYGAVRSRSPSPTGWTPCT